MTELKPGAMARALAGATSLAVVMAACASGAGNGRTAMMATGDSPDAAAHAVLMSVNMGEVEEGQLALSSATSAEVRQYAQMMVTEHSGAIGRQQALLNDMGARWDFAMAAPDWARGMGMGGGVAEVSGTQGAAAGLREDRPSSGVTRTGVAAEPVLNEAQAGNPAAGRADTRGTQPGRAEPVQGQTESGGVSTVSGTQGAAAGERPDRPSSGPTRTGIVAEPVLNEAQAGNPAAGRTDVDVGTPRTGDESRQNAHAGMQHGNMAMATDHAGMMHPLATALMNSRYARPIVEDHHRAMTFLRSQPRGMAFDMAYIDRQIAAHEYALRAIDNLMPSVRAGGSSQTMALLEQMRGSVNMHLARAREIRGRLS
jgi:predicted outer membrane protein